MDHRLALAAVGLVATVALGACGSGGAPAEQAATPASPGGVDVTGGNTTADLPAGVAATVGNTDIPNAVVKERVDIARQNPQVAGQLKGTQGTQLTDQIEAQVLSQLIVNEIVRQGAATEGIEVSEQEVTQRRDALVKEVGGQEKLAAQLRQAAIPESQLGSELEALIAFQRVRQKLQADTSDAKTGTPGPGGDQSAVQQWLVERLATTQVRVDRDYGRWAPTQGQVVPQAPGPATQPTG